MSEKNNNGIWRKLTFVTGAILGISGIVALAMNIVLQVYIYPVMASREALATLEAKTVTKEVFDLTLKQYEITLANMKDGVKANTSRLIAQNEKLDKIIFMLKQVN